MILNHNIMYRCSTVTNSQVIIAMANKQYLCDAGSETMITFIVDQCVASSKVSHIRYKSHTLKAKSAS